MRTLTTAIALAALLAAACSDDADGSASTATPRDLYEHHLDMTPAEIVGLLEACPHEDGHDVPLHVRTLSAPQISGVDMRVEFSDFMTHKRATCMDEYLQAHGAKEFETDTIVWPSEETFSVSSSTSTTG